MGNEKSNQSLSELLQGLPMDSSEVANFEKALKKKHEVCIGEYPYDIASSLVSLLNDSNNIMAYTENLAESEK